MANLAVFLTLLLLAVWIQHGESVRCWTCSSETDAACEDPFPAGQRDNYRFTLTNCDASATPNLYYSSSKSVCKKQKIFTNNRLITIRSCSWKPTNDYTSTCPSNRAENSAFCETCDYDACNSASASSYFLALLAAPVGLLLFK